MLAARGSSCSCEPASPACADTESDARDCSATDPKHRAQPRRLGFLLAQGFALRHLGEEQALPLRFSVAKECQIRFAFSTKKLHDPLHRSLTLWKRSRMIFS